MGKYLDFVLPYPCKHCKGEALVEHIGEDIIEPCEHCDGLGRWETPYQKTAPNMLIIRFNNWLKQRGV